MRQVRGLLWCDVPRPVSDEVEFARLRRAACWFYTFYTYAPEGPRGAGVAPPPGSVAAFLAKLPPGFLMHKEAEHMAANPEMFDFDWLPIWAKEVESLRAQLAAASFEAAASSATQSSAQDSPRAPPALGIDHVQAIVGHLNTRRDVVRAATCSKSLLPLASMADKLMDWEALNAWFELKQERGGPGNICEHCVGHGPRVAACWHVSAASGWQRPHARRCRLGLDIEGVSMRFAYRPHALRIDGPAKARAVLKALSEQVTKEVHRNLLLQKLAATVMHNITFVEDPAGNVKWRQGKVGGKARQSRTTDVKGKTFTRKLEKIERSGDDDVDEDDDECWISIGKTPPKKKEPLYKQLGVTAEWLLTNFGKLMYPENSTISLNVRTYPVLDVTKGPDPLAAMTLKKLQQLVKKYCTGMGAGSGGSTSFMQIMPAGHRKMQAPPTGRHL
ncbi:hypothetical protein FOA52_016086 [Chlamydomonas sp. UWO 241]|nr:hypothetical protein FOA52_016086 [Chlamydomonas sp. UWO 241]